MPDLAGLDEATRSALARASQRLLDHTAAWADRYLLLTRTHIPDYDVLADEEIRASATAFMNGIVGELASLRVPDDALRERVQELAMRRAGQGISLDSVSRSYQLGSREMLAIMDEVAEEVGLPAELVLAVHDSTWEFAAEAAAVFARVQRDLSVERARFDAERQAGFARGVLGGALSVEQLHRDAHLFGLDPRLSYIAVAARAESAGEQETLRRRVAVAGHVGADRLLIANMGSSVGVIAPAVAWGQLADGRVGASTPRLLEDLDDGFEEALVALETAEHFGIDGVVRLTDLGPRPLVLAADRTAVVLERELMAVLDADTRSGAVVAETVLVFLECDQDAAAASLRLCTHPNTIRYRVGRFRELTGLDVRRTEDLVTAWWLLARRRRGSLRPSTSRS